MLGKNHLITIKMKKKKISNKETSFITVKK